MNWTWEQKEAIELKHTDILVSAAAGSGKTAVLVERVIRAISEGERPLDLDQLLVLTFTDAAAQQMKQKISLAISKRLEQFPHNKHLRKQMSLLNTAPIMTLHSFCLQTIRSHFQQTPYSYECKVGQASELAMLETEALEETFYYYYEKADEAFQRFIDYFGGKDDEPVFHLIEKTYRFLRSIPFYREWLEKQTQFFYEADSLLHTPWGAYLFEDIKERLRMVHGLLTRGISLLKEQGEQRGIAGYLSAFEEDLRQVEELQQKSSWNDLFFALSSLTFPSLKPISKGGDKVFAEEIKTVRKNAREILEELRKKYFCQTEEEWLSDLATAGEYMQILKHVIDRFDDLFLQKKQQHDVMDFGDFEHICIALLTEKDGQGNISPSPLALELQERFQEVLIDEYQDINDVQELILQLVSRPQGRFMVGDIKQSIYGFRNARPTLFLDKYHHYAREAGQTTRCLMLSKNFRSTKPVLSFVNYLFEQLMCQRIGGVEYTQAEKLYFGEGYPQIPCEIEVSLLQKQQAEGEESLEMEDKTEFEAQLVAKHILKALQSEIYDIDTQTMRPCQYRDITILLRSVKGKAEVYAKVLEQNGIPTYLEQGRNYFETEEMKTAMALLQVLDNPRQDIPLLAVMRSCAFSFSDDELVQIRLQSGKKKSYYACVKEMADSQNEKCKHFLDTLFRWRSYAGVYPMKQLLQKVFQEGNLESYFGNRKDGEIRKANLRLLYDWAGDFEKTSYRGLFSFVQFLKRQIQNAELATDVCIGAHSGNAVTIMSIHKSKGLESNVIILADCGKKFNMQDLYGRLLLDDKLGLGPDLADLEERLLYPTIAKRAIACKQEKELRAEELRLLYVAMTRAKQKLIITGYSGAFEKWYVAALAANPGENMEHGVEKASSYMDWILLGLMQLPSAGLLRKNTSNLLAGREGEFSLRLSSISEGELFALPTEEAQTETEETIFGNPKAVEDVLAYTYAYQESCHLPAKISVSELKRRFDLATSGEETVLFFPKEIQERQQTLSYPSFLQSEKAVSPTQRGIAYHTVMQFLDFKKLATLEQVEEQLTQMVSDGRLSREEREVLCPKDFFVFGHSALNQMLQQANPCYREQEFLLYLPSRELFGQAEEQVMVQGVIDCVFEWNGDYYLVDYKTDRDTEKIATRYQVQMHLYAIAIEKLFGKRPIKRFLYLFHTGETVEV